MAKIIVVEDDIHILELLTRVLNKNGHEVLAAYSGLDGLRQATIHQTDILITDLQMPEMDGLQLIAEIKLKFPDAKIIAMSGNKKEYLDTAKTLGAAITLSKPFQNKALIEAVDSLI